MPARFTRSLLVLAFTASLCAAAENSADENTDQAAPDTESVQFDGQTLVLAFQGDNPGEHLKEYIPEGEKLESWTKLASIREYPDLNDPAALVKNVAEALHKQYPDSPSKITNADNGQVLIDFVVWPPDVSFVEFNVFKYAQRDGGGVVAQQYAVRAYGKQGQKFLKGLRAVRERLVPLMEKDGLEVSQ